MSRFVTRKVPWGMLKVILLGFTWDSRWIHRDKCVDLKWVNSSSLLNAWLNKDLMYGTKQQSLQWHGQVCHNYLSIHDFLKYGCGECLKHSLSPSQHKIVVDYNISNYRLVFESGGWLTYPNLIDNQSCHLFYYHIIKYVSTNFFLMFVLTVISHRFLPFFNLGTSLFGSILIYF